MSSITNKCVICFDDKSDKIDSLCDSNHYYCVNCLNTHYENMLICNRPIDNKCCVKGCFKPYYMNKLESYLSEDVKSACYKLDVFENFKIPSNLYIMSCPVCPNKAKAGIFLVAKNDYIQFYQCEEENCSKYVCLYCYKECTDKSAHVKCKQYINICNEMEKIIEYAICTQCPRCKKRIINNQYDTPCIKAGCTHMRCNICNHSYCYVCKGHDEDVDKSISVGSLITHNIEWTTNSKRCPQYIKSFSEIVLTWEKTDDLKATNDFDNYRTKSYLKKLIDRHGKDKVITTYNHFKAKRLDLIPEEFVKFDYTKFTIIPIIENKIHNIVKI